MKRGLSSAILPILIIGLVTFSSILLNSEAEAPNNSEAPWWKNDWEYRSPVKIIGGNSTSNHVENYQILIKLNYTNFDFTYANPAGYDLRFVYYNTTDETQKELNHWIESWNYTTWEASIWVKLPYIPPNDSITIYMYYGNPDAESNSNFDAVFQKLIADEHTVVLWHFDEGEGNKTLDTSKYPNHGFLYNSTWDRDATFTSGSSLKFNGNNSHIEIPYSSILDLVESFTIEAWIKPYDTYNGQFVLVKKTNPYWGFNYALGVGGKPGGANAFNKAWFSYYSVENGQRYIISNMTLEPRKWHHIVGIKDGYHNWLYVNGAQAAYGMDANQTPRVGDQPLYIGALLAPGYGTTAGSFNGTIDEVRILSRALTPIEVRADYKHRKYVFPEPKATVKPLRPIELTVLEPKSAKIGGIVTFIINVTFGHGRVTDLSVEVLNNSQLIFTLNATRISETVWHTTEWDTIKHPERIYQLQAEVLDISGNTIKINLTEIQVEQNLTFKILSFLFVMAIPLTSLIIVAISLLLVIRGFKPKWYYFLFFPALFIALMVTYDTLKPTWENMFSTNPWASTTFTFAIVIAMFILWTATLKEEKEQRDVKENTNPISSDEIK